MIRNAKGGFTLAEVLTTLMVIGVVAAMTIPTLLNATQDQQHRVALRKAMSVLSQGIQLMVAQERECVVGDSHQLAVCMQNVISGTLYERAAANGNNNLNDSIAVPANPNLLNGTGNIIVTNDGIAYAFYYNPNGVVDGIAQAAPLAADLLLNRSLDDICGTAEDGNARGGNNILAHPRGKFGTTQADYDGSHAVCYVVVDVDGPGKGAHGFIDGDTYLGRAFDNGLLAGSEQQALLLTGGGVRPIWNNALPATNRINQGYQWIYGDGKAPFANVPAGN